MKTQAKNKKPPKKKMPTRPGMVLGFVMGAVLLSVSFKAGVNYGRRQPIESGRHPHRQSPAALGSAVAEPAANSTKKSNSNETAVPAANGSNNAALYPAFPLAGEFEKQSAIMLSVSDMIQIAPDTLQQIVAAAWRNVKLLAIASKEEDVHRCRQLLSAAGLPGEALQIITLPCDSMWIRDYGPIFVKRRDESVFLIDLSYGYEDRGQDVRALDDRFPQEFARWGSLQAFSAPLLVDGGNMISNGQGLLVTSTDVITRNAKSHFDKQDEMHFFARYFGTRFWAFVPCLQGERTGHVDMSIAFLAPDVVVVGSYDPAYDAENAQILDEQARILSDPEVPGGPLKVHRIPMPPRVDGSWRTYTNLIFANGVLLVPRYKHVNQQLQQQAFDLYRHLMPDWKIVGIDCESLLLGRGALHCVSLNVPQWVPLDGRSKKIETTQSEVVTNPDRGQPLSIGAD